jgi:hypothetical protein
MELLKLFELWNNEGCLMGHEWATDEMVAVEYFATIFSGHYKMLNVETGESLFVKLD